MGIVQNLIDEAIVAVGNLLGWDSKPPVEDSCFPTVWQEKYPRQVKALRYDGTAHMAEHVAMWLIAYGVPVGYDCGQEECTGREEDHILHMFTLDGDRVINPGDWVVQKRAGEFDCYNADMFAATYMKGAGQ